MGRLIDADKFKKDNERLLNCDFPYLAEDTLEELIDSAPTVDAEPVRHGRWIDTNEGTYCSECGDYPYDDGEFHILHWRSDYCPNCGADMRETE